MSDTREESSAEVGTALILEERNHPLPAVPNPLDLPNLEFAQGLERRKQNRDTLIQWVRQALVEGIDFGRLHIVKKGSCKEWEKDKSCKEATHFSKPILFKPGAEKICGMLGLTPRYPMLEEYERAVITGAIIKHVILRCELYNTAGEKVAEGVGARTVEKDYHDLNKSLKMAEKSGHIDATLRMGGLSEIFTQDEESIRNGEEADKTLTEEHHLIFYNMIKDAGIFDSEAKIQRQLTNLAKALGHDSITEIPDFLFDTCKAQLEKGIAQKKKAAAESAAQKPAAEPKGGGDEPQQPA